MPVLMIQGTTPDAGKTIHDPHGVEGDPGSCQALDLLDIHTTLETNKQLKNVQGTLALNGSEVSGYEIHSGVTRADALKQPAVRLHGRTDGAISDDGQVLGTYLHGLFESADACQALLEWSGLKTHCRPDYRQRRENDINRLANALEEHLEMPAIYALLGLDEVKTTFGRRT